VIRLAAVAIALALATLVALPAAGSGIEPSRAEAGECAWKRQTKRVVKHVRRHGKVRRVVRKRHRWVCRPVAQAPVFTVPPTPVAPAPPPAPEPEEEANRLSVRASEFYFVLSRPSVRAGELTVELNNQGEDPHDLNLQAKEDEGPPLQIPETDSQQRSVAEFELAAGKYRLWCSLPEHDSKGMHATLLVE
jgi:plastocyanin